MTTTLNEYADGLFASGVASLGMLVWHHVPDLRIKVADLEALARQHGLTDTPLLKHPADAFRCATSTQQVREGSTRYLVRPVVDNAEKIVRHVIAEQVDAKDVTLSHEHVATMLFDKGSATMRANVYPAGRIAEPTVLKMLDDAVAEFLRLRDGLTGMECTRYLQAKLAAMSRISIHPNGGVYFVPAMYRDSLKQLAGFVDGLSQYTVEPEARTTFQAVPIPDVPSLRNTIDGEFRLAVDGELQALIAETAEYLGRETRVPKSVVEVRAQRMGEAIRKAEDYRAILGVSISDLEVKAKLLEQQIDELGKRTEGVHGDPLLERVNTLRVAYSIRETVNDRTVRLTRAGNNRRTQSVQFKCLTTGWTIDGYFTAAFATRPDVRAVPTAPGQSRIKTKDVDVAMLAIKNALGIEAA